MQNSLCTRKARDILQIPVLRVLGWSANSNNPVGSEYMIMEEATGTQLAYLWDRLNPGAKLAIMREVVSIESKMLSVSFSQYVLVPLILGRILERLILWFQLRKHILCQ